MRYCATLLILVAIFISCSKKNTSRSDFARLTLGGQEFHFDSLEAVFDTTVTDSRSCSFMFRDRASNSSLVCETLSGSAWINGTYPYPGDLLPGRALVYLHLQTYIDRVPGTYTLLDKPFTLIIDKSENGRMHGTLSGKITCYTCTPYGIAVDITDGEFELPYSYR